MLVSTSNTKGCSTESTHQTTNIAVLERAAANWDFDAHVTLQRERITAKPFLPQGIVTATEIFNRPRKFEIGPGQSAVHLPVVNHSQFSRALRSLSNLDYVGSVESLHRHVQDLAGEDVLISSTQRWLEDSNRVDWLDDNHRCLQGRRRGQPVLRQ